MANRNTKAKNKLARKEKKHFHGTACNTSWKNPNSKRKSAWRGAKPSVGQQ